MKISAGILSYRFNNGILEFFLVHPGGPFWKNKDIGAWSIPKGEVATGEDLLSSAIREFKEETGIECNGDFSELDPVILRSGKKIYAWALRMDIDPEKVVSNNFSMQWPPNSGKFIDVPEVDKAGWFGVEAASHKLNPAQIPLIVQASAIINAKMKK